MSSPPPPRTLTDAAEFVHFFRSTAPYLHAHRGRTFVIRFGGELLRSPGLRPFVHDIALLHALGIRLVLVVGARPQIDERSTKLGAKPRFAGGLRITNPPALQAAKEAEGVARVELEALLSTGLATSPMAGARIRVASGNFVTAQPVGVLSGIDYGFTGRVRRIDAASIRTALDRDSIVVMGCIGYSVTGEAFNVSTYDVATATATAIAAQKLICLVEGSASLRTRRTRYGELLLPEAKALIQSKARLADDTRLALGAAVGACEGGVERAHLVRRNRDGGLLLELFTREGAGLLVTRRSFDDLRKAELRDVPGILTLIEPLAESGVLVRRPREMLEMDIERFSVIERDGLIVAVAALYPLEKGIAELACVAVHPDYREAGQGDALLEYILRQCAAQQIHTLVALTTQTAHWFLEHGFVRGRPADLPASRRKAIDRTRGSKVFTRAVPTRVAG